MVETFGTSPKFTSVWNNNFSYKKKFQSTIQSTLQLYLWIPEVSSYFPVSGPSGPDYETTRLRSAQNPYPFLNLVVYNSPMSVEFVLALLPRQWLKGGGPERPLGTRLTSVPQVSSVDNTTVLRVFTGLLRPDDHKSFSIFTWDLRVSTFFGKKDPYPSLFYSGPIDTSGISTSLVSPAFFLFLFLPRNKTQRKVEGGTKIPGKDRTLSFTSDTTLGDHVWMRLVFSTTLGRTDPTKTHWLNVS